MLLFRGQNQDAPFTPTDSRISNLGGDKRAVYFYGFNRRNSALAYALTNYKVFENDEYFDEENEWVEEGVFYKCSYCDSNPVMLNDIDMSKLSLSLPSLYEALHEIDESLFSDLEEFVKYSQNFNSALELIEMIDATCSDYEVPMESFEKIIAPILNDCGTSIANSFDHETGEMLRDEYVVYRISDVSILKKVPVTKQDIHKIPLKERLKMSPDEITKEDLKHLDNNILTR